MCQNFRSDIAEKCAQHLKPQITNHSIFSQHGNHGRRPPRPLPPPIVLRRPFRHDRPLPHSNYNIGYARFFMISSGGAGKTKFVSNHIFKGRIKNIHDNQMGFSAAPRHPAPIPTRYSSSPQQLKRRVRSFFNDIIGGGWKD
jgi:hypothetical protein